MAVKVFDAGGKVILAGTDSAEVEVALGEMLGQGARLVSPLTQLGSKWVAACTHAPRSQPIVDTLSISEGVPASGLVEGDQDECSVETFGLKCIVTGPTRLAVELRVEEIVRRGANLVGVIEQDGEVWVAVCDSGGVQNSDFRW